MEPKITALKEIPVAYIETKVTFNEWSAANALFSTICEWVFKNRGDIAGPLFYQYLIIGDFFKKYHVRAGVVTKKLMKGDDRVRTTTLPRGKYISFIHEGHPDKLDESHDLIHNWAKKKKINIAKTETETDEIWTGRYEFYLTDADDEPDLTKWETDIMYLLK